LHIGTESFVIVNASGVAGSRLAAGSGAVALAVRSSQDVIAVQKPRIRAQAMVISRAARFPPTLPARTLAM